MWWMTQLNFFEDCAGSGSLWVLESPQFGVFFTQEKTGKLVRALVFFDGSIPS